MAPTQSLRVLRHQLHLSYNQVYTYLTCSLRYYFQYVKGFAPEHTSSALILGSAIHAGLARYFDGIKGEAETPESLLEFYRDAMTTALANPRAPILFGSDATNADELLALGEKVLCAYMDNPGFAGMEVVATELPLSMPLVTPDGRVTDFHLIGAIDLLLRDQLGRLLAVDHKTARNALTQDTIDQDLQLSAHTLLLQHNGYVEPDQNLHCSYNVIRKLKTPKIEKHLTTRTAADTLRFNRIANAVLSGIEAEVFLPCTGWQCSGCAYQEQRRSW